MDSKKGTPRDDFSAESDGLREAHETLHNAISRADPTGQRGRPFLVTGFILVIVAVLAVMLAIGIANY